MLCAQLTAVLMLSFVMDGSSMVQSFSIRSFSRDNCLQSKSVMRMGLLKGDISTKSPRVLVTEGMKAFCEGRIEDSIDLFDQADRAVPDGSLRPYLWQRGISYYYLDDFASGSRQFRFDVQVNPLDVEEIVWDIACLFQLQQEQQQQQQQRNMSVPNPALGDYDRLPSPMSLPNGKRDRRKIMSTIYSLFRGECSELALALEGYVTSSLSDAFYSLFYLGLYCESKGETAKAESYMKAAASSTYATTVGLGDYMTSCARVHCRLRGWNYNP